MRRAVLWRVLLTLAAVLLTVGAAGAGVWNGGEDYTTQEVNEVIQLGGSETVGGTLTINNDGARIKGTGKMYLNRRIVLGSNVKNLTVENVQITGIPGWHDLDATSATNLSIKLYGKNMIKMPMSLGVSAGSALMADGASLTLGGNGDVSLYGGQPARNTQGKGGDGIKAGSLIFKDGIMPEVCGGRGADTDGSSDWGKGGYAIDVTDNVVFEHIGTLVTIQGGNGGESSINTSQWGPGEAAIKAVAVGGLFDWASIQGGVGGMNNSERASIFSPSTLIPDLISGTQAPEIDTHPQDIEAELGEEVTFSVTVKPGANPAPSYQWFTGADPNYLNMDAISAADTYAEDSDTLTATGNPTAVTADLKVTLTDANKGYYYRCRVSNGVNPYRASNAVQLKLKAKDPGQTTDPGETELDDDDEDLEKKVGEFNEQNRQNGVGLEFGDENDIPSDSEEVREQLGGKPVLVKPKSGDVYLTVVEFDGGDEYQAFGRGWGARINISIDVEPVEGEIHVLPVGVYYILTADDLAQVGVTDPDEFVANVDLVIARALFLKQFSEGEEAGAGMLHWIDSFIGDDDGVTMADFVTVTADTAEDNPGGVIVKLNFLLANGDGQSKVIFDGEKPFLVIFDGARNKRLLDPLFLAQMSDTIMQIFSANAADHTAVLNINTLSGNNQYWGTVALAFAKGLDLSNPSMAFTLFEIFNNMNMPFDISEWKVYDADGTVIAEWPKAKERGAAYDDSWRNFRNCMVFSFPVNNANDFLSSVIKKVRFMFEDDYTTYAQEFEGGGLKFENMELHMDIDDGSSGCDAGLGLLAALAAIGGALLLKRRRA